MSLKSEFSENVCLKLTYVKKPQQKCGAFSICGNGICLMVAESKERFAIRRM